MGVNLRFFKTESLKQRQQRLLQPFGGSKMAICNMASHKEGLLELKTYASA